MGLALEWPLGELALGSWTTRWRMSAGGRARLKHSLTPMLSSPPPRTTSSQATATWRCLIAFCQNAPMMGTSVIAAMPPRSVKKTMIRQSVSLAAHQAQAFESNHGGSASNGQTINVQMTKNRQAAIETPKKTHGGGMTGACGGSWTGVGFCSGAARIGSAVGVCDEVMFLSAGFFHSSLQGSLLLLYHGASASAAPRRIVAVAGSRRCCSPL